MDYNRSVTDLGAVVISASGHVAGDLLPFQTASQNNTVGGVAGVLLGVGTYRFLLGSPSGDSTAPAQTALSGVQLSWVAAMAGTISLVTCNFPGFLDKFGRGGVDVTDFDTTYWVKHDPSTNVYIPVTGASNTVTNATVTMGGAAAGNAVYECGNLGDRRVGFTVVTTAGGIIRVNACSKLGV
jgi:hypothetical protein